MAPSLKNPFKRKAPIDKNKVVLKAADKQYTEISISRVEKSRACGGGGSAIAPAPLMPSLNDENDASFVVDVPTLQQMVKQRNAQIASLKNELAKLTCRVADMERQAASCQCGAYQREATSGPPLKSHFSKW